MVREQDAVVSEPAQASEEKFVVMDHPTTADSTPVAVIPEEVKASVSVAKAQQLAAARAKRQNQRRISEAEKRKSELEHLEATNVLLAEAVALKERFHSSFVNCKVGGKGEMEGDAEKELKKETKEPPKLEGPIEEEPVTEIERPSSPAKKRYVSNKHLLTSFGF